MNDEKLMQQNRDFYNSLLSFNINSIPQREYYQILINLCKNIDKMKLTEEKIDYVKEHQKMFIDLKANWIDMPDYWSDIDKVYKKDIFERLDNYLAKFKDIKDEKRADENLEVEKANLAESRRARILARRANKIAVTAIVIACLGTIIGILVTVFLRVFGSN